MTVAGYDYHCALTIAGVKYLMTGVDLAGWCQEKDVNPFAPKITMGEQSYSDFSMWSVLGQEDWRHGFGHKRFEDPQGYHKTSGSIDTRHKDVVQLATAIRASDEDLKVQAYQMIDFLSNVYACYDGSSVGSELLSNEGFETAGAGGDDVWANWTEVKSSSTWANETGNKHGGSDAAKVTTGAASDTAHVYQDVTVTAGKHYTLTIWVRGTSGDAAGYYKIYDQTGSADIVAKTSTGVTSETYTNIGKCFTAPASCTTVRIYLYCSTTNTDVYYFDDISVKEGTSGIRKFTTAAGTWAGVDDIDVIRADVYSLLNNGAYLFAGLDDAQVLKSSDGAAFTTTGVDAEAKDYRYMALGGGKLWTAIDADNHVHWATSLDASDWDGDENDTNRITVGPGDPTAALTSVPITALAWYDGFLYVPREDGLWRIYPDDNVAYQVLDWTNERRTTNGKGMLVWQDKLIIPKGPQLLAFTGTTISDITPPSIGQSFPYTGYGNFQSLATFGPYLYVSAQEGAASTTTETVSLRPNAAGTTTELDPYPAEASNYENVDETIADYFTTSNYSGSYVYELDLYNQSATGLSTETINKITVHAVATGGPKGGTIKGAVKVDGDATVYYGSEQTIPSDSSWATYSWDWVTNPSTSSAWTRAQLDALEAGFAILQGEAGVVPAMRVTQVWVEVEYELSTGTHRLLCWDGAAWHKLGDLDSGGKCLWLSPATDDLWINDYDSTDTNYNTRYIQVQEHSFLPKDDYATSGTHSLELSRIDCKLRLVDKCFHELYVESNNLTAARYLTAYYRTSGETWVSLGNVTQSPIETVDLSDITGKYIDLRVDFVTDSATESPILEALALKYVARPTTIYGHTLSFEIGPKIKALNADIIQDYSTKEWHDALKAARDSTVPITYETPYGEEVSVFVTAIGFPEHVFEGKGEVTGTATISIAEVD